MGKAETVAKGTMAEVGLQVCESTAKKQRENYLNELKGLYRNGTCDGPLLFAKVAAICALDDLLSDLNRQIKTGRKTDQKEVLNGPAN